MSPVGSGPSCAMAVVASIIASNAPPPILTLTDIISVPNLNGERPGQHHTPAALLRA